jgi:chemotaxis protein MotA
MVPALVLVAFVGVAIVRPEFIHLPSLLLTLGGSIAVVLFSYSPRQLRDLLQISRCLLAEKPVTPQEFAEELSRLTGVYRAQGLRGLENAERRLADPFLRRAVGMLVDLQKEEKIYAALDRASADAVSRHELARQILLTLGKLLPAFGLMGTLVGMVLLLRDLYTQDVQSLPAALSLAVLTTLYGAVFANVMVAPLAARLNAAATEKELRMGMTVDWVMAFVRGDSAPSTVRNVGGQRPPAETLRGLGERGWATLFPSPLR